ncbi:MAG: hypothetical protein BWY89_01587 [Bacteroidetes bacterium ADurb.BinA012]|nr:MAG: hypothetical protein BWY89_01587 [Bacteroidetes bacterium ADurb.BinA012]
MLLVQQQTVIAGSAHLEQSPVSGKPFLRENGNCSVRQRVFADTFKNVSPETCKGNGKRSYDHFCFQIEPVIYYRVTDSHLNPVQREGPVKISGTDYHTRILQSLSVIGDCFNKVVHCFPFRLPGPWGGEVNAVITCQACFIKCIQATLFPCRITFLPQEDEMALLIAECCEMGNIIRIINISVVIAEF